MGYWDLQVVTFAREIFLHLPTPFFIVIPLKVYKNSLVNNSTGIKNIIMSAQY